MARKATAGVKPKANRKAPPQAAAAEKVKIKGKKAKKGKKVKKGDDAVKKLAKFAESPIVSELIAVGATAAVAAIAASLTNKSGRSSNSDAVRKAGKAAASAIGARLVEEYKAVKDAADEAARKRGA